MFRTELRAALAAGCVVLAACGQKPYGAPTRVIILGASLGSDAELANARAADYVGIGPVFGSSSKDDAGSAIGVDGFERLAGLVEVPAIAVGGITADRALQITVHGAAGVALINSIFSSDDPERATREIAAAIGM